MNDETTNWALIIFTAVGLSIVVAGVVAAPTSRVQPAAPPIK